MRRYDQILGFDGKSSFIKNIPRQKVDFAGMALLRHREDGLGQGDDEEIVRQFGLSGMHEFWEVELSEPMTCKAFQHALAVHLVVPREPTQSFEAHIRQALRAARSYNKSWFMEIPDPPPSTKLRHPYRWVHLPGKPDPVLAHVVPADPPADGIDLNKLRVQPRAAVEWMLSSAQRRHLVPPSLVAAIRGETVDTNAVAVSPIKPPRGRKKGTGYQKVDEPLARRMLEMTGRSEAQSLSEAARVLIGPDGKGAKGIGEPEAKVERLVRVANALMNAESNRG